MCARTEAAALAGRGMGNGTLAASSQLALDTPQHRLRVMDRGVMDSAAIVMLGIWARALIAKWVSILRWYLSWHSTPSPHE